MVAPPGEPATHVALDYHCLCVVADLSKLLAGEQRTRRSLQTGLKNSQVMHIHGYVNNDFYFSMEPYTVRYVNHLTVHL